MALTANITTPDGVEHPSVFGMVYPVTMQTIEGDTHVIIGLHAWHNEAAKLAGKSELAGYPDTITIKDGDALAAIGSGVFAMTALEFTGDPETDLPVALDAVVKAIENAVIAQRPEFSRVVE